MINFYMENQKIRFEININAVKEAQLNMNSQLLRLGRVVGGRND